MVALCDALGLAVTARGYTVQMQCERKTVVTLQLHILDVGRMLPRCARGRTVLVETACLCHLDTH